MMDKVVAGLVEQGCVHEPQESAKFEDRTEVYRAEFNGGGNTFFRYYVKSNTTSLWAFTIQPNGKSYYSYALFENRRNAKMIADWEDIGIPYTDV